MRIVRWSIWCLVWLAAGGVASAWAQLVPNWSTLGPVGGSVTSLAQDPGAAKSIYAGTDDNGLFFSADLGATWLPANSGISAPGGRHVYAMAVVDRYLVAALDGGLYFTEVSGAPKWKRFTSPLSVGCDLTVLTAIGSTLYAAAPCVPKVFSTSVSASSPNWKFISVPTSGSIGTVAELEGQPVVGVDGSVYILDSGGLEFVSSEAKVTGAVVTGTVVSIASNSSRWAFACTRDGKVYQGDLSFGRDSVAWRELTFTSYALPFNCNSLGVDRVAASPARWVLHLATDAGAFISTPFDDLTDDAPNLMPGVEFPLSNHVNFARLVSTADSTWLFWATEFGVYSNTVAELLDWKIPAAPSVRNGPGNLVSPSLRLDNVNVTDVAQIGQSLYAIIQSGGRPSYSDVVRSSNGGATWEATGLTKEYSFSEAIGRIRVLAADTVNKVLYAGTEQGVFALRESTARWSRMGNASDVRALVVGSQAYYAGLEATTVDDDGNVTVLPSGGMVIHSLIDKPMFAIDAISMTSLPLNFSVRALAIDGGLVYAAGGSPGASGGLYENSVFVASDYMPGTNFVSWARVGGAPLSSKPLPIVRRIAVGAGTVFVGGDGYLRKNSLGKPQWDDVPGLPLLSNGDGESVSGLATDGNWLYVGIFGAGMWSWKIGSTFSMQAINSNVSGTSNFPSPLVNGLRYMDGRIFAVTSAGIVMASPVEQSLEPADKSSGGGCTLATSERFDPILWLLVVAAWVLVFRRSRVGMYERQRTAQAHEGWR